MPSLYEPGEIVTADPPEFIYVYEIFDAFAVLYVGKTNNPQKRLHDHINTRFSKLAEGMGAPKLRIASRHTCPVEAGRAERALIAKHGRVLQNIKSRRW